MTKTGRMLPTVIVAKRQSRVPTIWAGTDAWVGWTSWSDARGFVELIRPHVIHETACQTDGWDGLRWKTLISSDRTPTCDLTQGVAELDPAPPETFPVHCHAHAETYYVLSGQGILRIGEEQFALSPGVIAFIPGGAHHTTCATGDERLRILYTFAADSFSDVVYEFPGLNADTRG